MAVELVTRTFEPHVGQPFQAQPVWSGDPLELVLESCVESPHARPGHPAFSLFFAASDQEVRGQQIFRLRNSELGEFELFLVPVGPQLYEAVIN